MSEVGGKQELQNSTINGHSGTILLSHGWIFDREKKCHYLNTWVGAKKRGKKIDRWGNRIKNSSSLNFAIIRVTGNCPRVKLS